MRDLNYDLKRLQAARDDGSHGTRKARSYALAQIANTLHDLGFKGLRAPGLRRKHAVALVEEWKRQGRSVGTMKNRTA
ncbi:MAG: integrase, partial [Gammaproteobacteria bacterium]|nr:integrase [Gammaproteobacteria bacterium]